jgi:UDP-N-acetylglucosamine--N-acetylmuramyl-(pentapeptide) pyrophosphoryl-undecaprenol N-acetylglucosamine transferase
VAPALAVADALRADGAEVAFIGGERAESELVPRAGYPLRRLSVEGLSRSNPLRAARALARAVLALPRAVDMLRELRPDAVLGAGGYVAGPVGLAALSLRVPLVLSEADNHLGVTNRLLARGARRVCLAFPLPGRDGERYRVTGRPVPAACADRAGARAHFGIAAEQTCVLVFGGSLGARSINLAAMHGLGGSADGATRVLHIAGRRDYPELARQPRPAGYDLREYLELDEFAQALAAADLVVARAGGSVFEIAAYGLAAILVPYPHAAADHQSANARWMADGGAAVVIADGELSARRLAQEVGALLADPARRAAMARAARALARPEAARDVAGELLQAAGA